jgi:glycosyltransferase involved in cell wall biosynthesis
MMHPAREPISFIIPAYNCAKVIGEAVQSIFDHNLQQGDEIIVVDDSSTDNTSQILDALRRTHESLRVLRHRENRGTAAAGRNTAIEAARNNLVFCLDSDNVLARGSLGGLYDYLRATGADAAAFGEIHYFQTGPEEVTHKWVYKPEVTLADALSGIIWPGPSGNYLFTRESWVRAGRYPEPYLENRSLDSWAFAIRQLGTGSRLVTLPGTWYFHRYGHESHYVQNWRRGNQSLAALMALTPFLDRIETEDVEYLFGKEGRYTWFEQLRDHPIKVKGAPLGRDGAIQTLRLRAARRLRRSIASMLEKASKRLRG